MENVRDPGLNIFAAEVQAIAGTGLSAKTTTASQPYLECTDAIGGIHVCGSFRFQVWVRHRKAARTLYLIQHIACSSQITSADHFSSGAKVEAR